MNGKSKFAESACTALLVAVGQRLAASEPKSPVFEAKKALELKEKGKTIKKFEEPFSGKKGSTDIDVTYTDNGVTKYLETSAYNWNKASGDDLRDLNVKLQKYIERAGEDASKVKFASEQGITPAVKNVLDDLGIELI